MESVNKKIIIAAIFLAFISTFLVYSYIKKATYIPETNNYSEVYVASNTLPQKHKIEESDIKISKVPPEYISPFALKDKKDIVGKYAEESIIEGEQILSDRLIDENNFTLAYKVPEGKRAVSIFIDDQSGVSNLIKPGDFVDVIASFDAEQVEEVSSIKKYPRIVKTVLQNTEVLAIGSELDVKPDENKKTLNTITLAVNIQEAEKLVYISNYSQLRLALRSVGDENTINTSGVIRQDLATDKGMIQVPK